MDKMIDRTLRKAGEIPFFFENPIQNGWNKKTNPSPLAPKQRSFWAISNRTFFSQVGSSQRVLHNQLSLYKLFQKNYCFLGLLVNMSLPKKSRVQTEKTNEHIHETPGVFSNTSRPRNGLADPKFSPWAPKKLSPKWKPTKWMLCKRFQPMRHVRVASQFFWGVYLIVYFLSELLTFQCQ